MLNQTALAVASVAAMGIQRRQGGDGQPLTRQGKVSSGHSRRQGAT